VNRYWHGGNAGLRPGDLVQPGHTRTVPDCPICQARANGHTLTLNGHAIDPATGRPDRVYLTTDREYARFYASMALLGDLYRVEPIGDLEPSTEDPFNTWMAPAARITAVYDRAVRLTTAQRRRLLARWP
jgi:hypothetical protein